ncbi:nucleoside hydrolase [Subtercola boreus]|uniref:Nucleoside hydrolase n=1 Tax=Subtercola boreus TaxID=120213 RepID=A0A3E0VL08_9MICO|nr:nucleoside hydrolase [Subtercola boreus]RFA10123.1 nucleoside hydrolase [Subtercola boreus]TQL52720.1 pyrimidine-specific ribonucleoside hydrolase [Subtercola boreus]
MKTTNVLLDVDTGVDDALAILFAVAHPGIALLGVSCVAGNAALPQVVQNTLKVLDAAGAGDIPVAAGATRPLIAAARDASHVHGSDGLGGIELPATGRRAVAQGSVAMLREQLLASDEPVTIIALAPQTNLALLLRTHPEVAAKIERILFMGGSASVGNATPTAEFNVWHDPEAAAIVLDSGIQTFMYGLDVFNRVSVPFEQAEALQSSGRRAERLAGALLSHRIGMGPGHEPVYTGLIGDAGAVCALVDPDALRIERLPVFVELAGASRGQTVVDRRQFPGEDRMHGLHAEVGLTDVALEVDADRYADLFLRTVALLD